MVMAGVRVTLTLIALHVDDLHLFETAGGNSGCFLSYKCLYFGEGVWSGYSLTYELTTGGKRLFGTDFLCTTIHHDHFCVCVLRLINMSQSLVALVLFGFVRKNPISAWYSVLKTSYINTIEF